MTSSAAGDYLFKKECCATLDDSAELAYVSTAVGPSDELDAYTNKVGGRAVLFTEQTMPQCSACHATLAVVIQAYLPLADPPDDRRQLVVCVCTNPACKLPPSKRFSAFRTKIAVSQDKTEHADSKKASSSESAPMTDAFAQPALFAECSWDVDDDSNSGDVVPSLIVAPNPVESSDPKEEKADEKGKEGDEEIPKSYVCSGEAEHPFEAYYIETDYEPESNGTSAAEDAQIRELLSRYEAQQAAAAEDDDDGDDGKTKSKGKGGKHGGGKKVTVNMGSGDEDVYEHSAGDRSFRRFQKRIQRAPEQILRWCYGGKPLQLCDATPLESLCIPRCPICGSRRVFEAQLMPSLLDKLHVIGVKPSPPPPPSTASSSAAKSGLPTAVVPSGSSPSESQFSAVLNQSLPYEFGSILICTCGNDCDTHGALVPEHLIWQPCL